MRHPSIESIARFLDERPSAEDAAHLSACESCRRTFEEMAEQRAALSRMPYPRPRPGDWGTLEARIEEAGLVHGDEVVHAPPMRVGAGSAAWTRAAAALALFLGGGMLGALFARSGEQTASSILLMDDGTLALVVAADTRAGWETFSAEEAERLVLMTELWHTTALQLYGARAGTPEEALATSDPVGRYLTLQTLAMATEAAVRGAPADPFLNGLHASTVAERRAQLERLSYAIVYPQ